MLLSEEDYGCAQADKAVVTTFSGVAMTEPGLSVEGGPTEVIHDRKAGMVTIIAHGMAGKRRIGVPAGQGEIRDKVLAWDGVMTGNWTLDYAGGSREKPSR